MSFSWLVIYIIKPVQILKTQYLLIYTNWLGYLRIREFMKQVMGTSTWIWNVDQQVLLPPVLIIRRSLSDVDPRCQGKIKAHIVGSLCEILWKIWEQKSERCRFLGKAAFLAGNLDTAESAYKKATEINPNLALAWKGLVELYEQIGRLNELQHVLENLVSIILFIQSWDKIKE